MFTAAASSPATSDRSAHTRRNGGRYAAPSGEVGDPSGSVSAEAAREAAGPLGPYRVMHGLPACCLATRKLAVHQEHQSTHVVYTFSPCHDKPEQRRFVEAVSLAATVVHPHVLDIETYGFDLSGEPWLITPFTGDVDGLHTLESVARLKGGRMLECEVQRATTQLLGAVSAGAQSGLRHGPIDPREVLIDRRGCLHIELFGLSRLIRGLRPAGDAELERDEVRSIVEIAYQLLTGLPAEPPIIPAERLITGMTRGWADWLARGLDPVDGFDSAAQAIAALPGVRASSAAQAFPAAQGIIEPGSAASPAGTPHPELTLVGVRRVLGLRRTPTTLP